ncbi:MAG: 2-C-methyl-D-erythritol 4-phosphate cytidylyltransferase [Chlamydiota bacterium]
MSVSVILLSGGRGTRFGGPLPKQYLPIHEKAAILYSFETCANHPSVSEIIVVCEENYRSLFPAPPHLRLAFALPGERRQDSVFHGFQIISPTAQLVCVHDGARPLLSHEDLTAVINAAHEHGAATLAIKAQNTIKEASPTGFIAKTLDRSILWEMQTPQVFTPDLLKKGFALANASGYQVTDDNSIVELTGHPIKLVQSQHCNLKITTAEDLLLAKAITHA